MVDPINVTSGVIAALVAALTHLANATGLPTKACPWFALALSVLGVFLVNGLNVSTIFTGLIIGFSSYGMWNGALDMTGKQQ